MTGRMEPSAYPSSVEEDLVMCWPTTCRGLSEHRPEHQTVGRSIRRTHPAFQSLKAHTEEAWSVVVRGDTDIIEDQADKDAVDSLRLEPWQPGEKAHYIRLTARALTGRRFKVNKPDIWNTRTTDRRRTSFE
jgi:hypothetical protein